MIEYVTVNTEQGTAAATESLRGQPAECFVRTTAAIVMNGEKGNSQNVAMLQTAMAFVTQPGWTTDDSGFIVFSSFRSFSQRVTLPQNLNYTELFQYNPLRINFTAKSLPPHQMK